MPDHRLNMAWLAIAVMLCATAALGQKPGQYLAADPPSSPASPNASPPLPPVPSQYDISFGPPASSGPAVPPCNEPTPGEGPPPSGRYRGPGNPLIQESWQHRPWSIGGFMGFAQGNPLIDDWVGATGGFLGGLRLGWDSNYYWGLETRLAAGDLDVYDSERAKAARPFADADRPASLLIWDVHLLYYPWGDSQWRPYLATGFGLGELRFQDRLSQCYDHTSFDLPLAIGLKYYWTDCWALRLECAHDILVGGGGVNTLHTFSVSGGIEWRFGGPRRAYWPWNPGRY
jgi:hypothetical protein